MGKEIITLHLGQAGVQLSHALWERVCVEHAVNPDGTKKSDLGKFYQFDQGSDFVFRSTLKGKLVPRALLIDLEPSVVGKCLYKIWILALARFGW